jgi:uncharacterized cupin superfamily protein
MFKNTPVLSSVDDLVLSDYDLQDMPGKVTSGPLKMRNNTIASTEDGKSITGVWECTPGAFTWQYPGDELQVVLSGKAEIRFESGVTLTVKKGDFFVCSQGERCEWRVIETIRKIYYIAIS